MTSAPGFSAATSVALGRRTLRRMSASRKASAAVGAISAPCARNTSSEKRERAPAPASTFTLAPMPTSFLTVSGDTATRGSSAASAVTAMVTMHSSDRVEVSHTAGPERPVTGAEFPARGAVKLDQEVGHPSEQYHQEGDRDLGEANERLVGLLSLRVIHVRIAASQIDGHTALPRVSRSFVSLLPQGWPAIKRPRADRRKGGAVWVSGTRPASLGVSRCGPHGYLPTHTTTGCGPRHWSHHRDRARLEA